MTFGVWGAKQARKLWLIEIGTNMDYLISANVS
jgi:hypothetical protein